MSASVDLHPARGDGRPLSLGQIKERLASMGIVHGLDLALLQTSIAEAEESKAERTGVPVARGTAPEQGRDAVIEYHFSEEESILTKERLSAEKDTDI